MDTVCLREFHSVYLLAFNESTIEVKWHFTVNGEDEMALLTHHRKEKEQMLRVTERIRSSAVEGITFWKLNIADEWFDVSSSSSQTKKLGISTRTAIEGTVSAESRNGVTSFDSVL